MCAAGSMPTASCGLVLSFERTPQILEVLRAEPPFGLRILAEEDADGKASRIVMGAAVGVVTGDMKVPRFSGTRIEVSDVVPQAGD